MLLPVPQLVECFAVGFRAHLHLSVWLNKIAFSQLITVGVFGSPWPKSQFWQDHVLVITRYVRSSGGMGRASQGRPSSTAAASTGAINWADS